jgi:hypothetical protein
MSPVFSDFISLEVVLEIRWSEVMPIDQRLTLSRRPRFSPFAAAQRPADNPRRETNVCRVETSLAYASHSRNRIAATGFIGLLASVVACCVNPFRGRVPNPISEDKLITVFERA